MDKKTILKDAGLLLIGTPILILGLIVLGSILALLNHRNENIIYTFLLLPCVAIGVVTPYVALGRAASLLGSSWILFGLVPILFGPLGLFISWLLLMDKRVKLKRTLENQVEDPA